MTNLPSSAFITHAEPTLLHQIIEAEPNLNQKVYFVVSNGGDRIPVNGGHLLVRNGTTLDNIVGYTHPMLASMIQILFNDLQWPTIWSVEATPEQQSVEGRVFLKKAKVLRPVHFPLCEKSKFRLAAGFVARVHKDKHYAEWLVDQYSNQKFAQYTSIELHEMSKKISDRLFLDDPAMSLELFGVANVTQSRILMDKPAGVPFMFSIAKAVFSAIYVAHVRGEPIKITQLLEKIHGE